jgi:defect in organelle trafficking protein DotD
MLASSSSIMKRRGAVALLVLMGLVACADEQPAQIMPLVAENDPVALQIAQAADKAAKALDTIAGIEQYQNPLPPMENFAGAPQPIAQRISIRWTGPAEQIVKTLAEKAGYRYQTAGAPGTIPLSVAVDAYERPLIDVLRDIGLQLGNRADVAVDINATVVQLRYAPTHGKN